MNLLRSKHILPCFAFAAALAVGAPSLRACSVCGCSLQLRLGRPEGYAVNPGLEADVIYQYYNQDDLRAGTVGADRRDYPTPGAQELQQDTLTRSATVRIDYMPAPGWGIDLDVPSYDRFHSTIAPGDTTLSESRASGLGDARVMARFQTFSMKHSFGLQLGIKLPTGRFNQDFATGPQAGSLLDRGLQLGSGTTDLVVGASYFGRLFPYVGYFGQIAFQQAVEQRDGFAPSATLTMNVGVRYLNSSSVTPMLQINTRIDGREHGVNADVGNSGGDAVYLSPGVTVDAGQNRSIFAFLQVPVYQRVNGLQLEPRWLLSTGVRWRL